MLNSIEEALIDLKDGKMVIVVDDENRENEGDFIMPAQTCKPSDINFMITHGRGLVCTPITQKIADQFKLAPMVSQSSDSMQTAFTVSIDASSGVSTGISTNDRARVISLLTDKNANQNDIVTPGHIFPLIAKDGGVLTREGHTEAAVDLSTLSGFSPVGVICEILNADGSCARVPDLKILAKEFDLKLISIEDLVHYKKKVLIKNTHKDNHHDKRA